MKMKQIIPATPYTAVYVHSTDSAQTKFGVEQYARETSVRSKPHRRPGDRHDISTVTLTNKATYHYSSNAYDQLSYLGSSLHPTKSKSSFLRLSSHGSVSFSYLRKL